MIRSAARSLGSVALLGLGVWGCSSASAADGGQSPTVNRSALAASSKTSSPSVPADAPPPPHKPALSEQPPSPAPASSAEDLGSAALEHRLDKLEKDIASSPP
jgi:hypothetical protein